MNPFKIIFLLLISHSIYSQIELWGMTTLGGNFNAGIVFKFTPKNNTHEVIHSFKDYENTPIIRNLIKASNGKYYGISDSGYKGFGSICEYNYELNQFSVVYNFGDGEGERCNKGLVEASNGHLYGVTAYGGTFNQGLLFSFDPNTYSFVKLYDFHEIDKQSFPVGNLYCSPENILYGTTSAGGEYNAGTAYKFDINSGTYSKIHDFNGSTDGSSPDRELTLGANGNLYSFSRANGANDLGTIFEINLLNNSFSKKIDLDNSIGIYPTEKLTLANDGNIYGIFKDGGSNSVGAIFQYNPITNQLSKKLDINWNIHGGRPLRGFLLGSDGFLYSITNIAINQYDYINNIYTKADIIENYGLNNLFSNSSNGKILGISLGGIEKFLFEYDITLNVKTNKYSFIGGINGLNPTGSLLKANDGNFYGMTPSGGNFDGGIIFRINPVSKIFEKLFDFDGINGRNPYGSLTEGENGNLYGLTYEGGVNLNYGGVLFKYNIQSNTFTKIFDFTENSNQFGSFTYGTLTKGLGSKMYSVSRSGIGIGNIFEFDTNTETIANLAGFTNSSGGGYPYNSPILTSNGKFYGMTSGENDFSPDSQGYLYEFNPQNNTITPKVNFWTQIGNAEPKGSLIEGKDKNLYGLTYLGGNNSFDNGVLFNFNPENSIFTNLHSFNGTTDGKYPSGTPSQASDGNIYGLTVAGGIHNSGVIFKYDPLLARFSKIFDFNGLNGASPSYTQLTERIATISTTKSGNWNDPTVWENGVVPTNTSFITIKTNHIIDVDGVPIAVKYIEVKGTLNFSNGGSLNLVE
jgi:uncharacterized repeat protein (TIGR03803 family)